MSLKLKIREVHGIVVIDLAGRITLGDPRVELRNTVHRSIADGPRRFILNLEHVDYVDSSGLGELVAIRTLLEKEGGHVQLVGLTRRVRDLLVISKLVVVFDCAESEATAIAALREAKVAVGSA
jgi:anti-sigma B factor antagonist